MSHGFSYFEKPKIWIKSKIKGIKNGKGIKRKKKGRGWKKVVPIHHKEFKKNNSVLTLVSCLDGSGPVLRWPRNAASSSPAPVSSLGADSGLRQAEGWLLGRWTGQSCPSSLSDPRSPPAGSPWEDPAPQPCSFLMSPAQKREQAAPPGRSSGKGRRCGGGASPPQLQGSQRRHQRTLRTSLQEAQTPRATAVCVILAGSPSKNPVL